MNKAAEVKRSCRRVSKLQRGNQGRPERFKAVESKLTEKVRQVKNFGKRGARRESELIKLGNGDPQRSEELKS